MSRIAYRAERLVTCDAARADQDDPLGVIEDAAMVVEDGRIAWLGEASNAPGDAPIVDLSGVVTPGLVDAHTHAAWVGSRHGEYAIRMAGGDYASIAASGGGILASHRALAGSSHDHVARVLAARLRRMARLGVTTCEIKSGYGLDPELELRQLQVMAGLRLVPDLPRIVPTFLALHALPPSHAGDRDGYVKEVLEATLPRVARKGLATYVDAYVDRDAFTVEEARRLGVAAKALGLALRLHVGQFSDIGGAELARELGAHSADHLEHIGDAGIAALVEGVVFAGLLPLAAFTLGQSPPPIAKMRAAGVAFVVASDANPGTAPTESLPLALAHAVRSYGLTPAEALLGATRHAAASLGLEGITGALAVGCSADFVHWDLPHENAIIQPWGVSRTRLVVRDGVLLSETRETPYV